jgi:hypothetical protein
MKEKGGMLVDGCNRGDNGVECCVEVFPDI